MDKVLWAITGSGHFLEECMGKIKELKENTEVDIALSHAGFEVVQMYGFLDPLKDYSNELFMEGLHGYSVPLVGRLVKKEYRALIVAPATANTVAKIVHGIADSLITNLVAQAMKSKAEVYILPTDLEKEMTTKLPVNLEKNKCRGCDPCPAMQNCPRNAFYKTDRLRISLLRCDACLNCIGNCKYDAISFGKKTKIYMRDIDLENTGKLRDMEGVTVLNEIDKLKL